MLGCHDCRDLLLDSLYDLLEPAEAEAVRLHLAGCADCRAALEKARDSQRLLADAAKMSFPDVRFVAPADEVPAPAPAPGPVTLPLRPRLALSRKAPPRWGRWAAAAAILVAMLGVGVPGYHAARDFADARDAVAAHERGVAGAKEELASVTDEYRRLAETRDAAFDRLRHEMKSRELRLVVSGPRAVQPGAPAEFLVRTTDLNGNPVAAEVHARLSPSADAGFAAPAVPTAPVPAPASVPPFAGGGNTGALAKSESAKADAPTKKADLLVRADGVGVYRITLPSDAPLATGAQAQHRGADMIVSAAKLGGAGAADKSPGRAVTLEGKVQLSTRAYLTHLATDKPMYHPGEVVYFRSLTVDRASLRPSAEPFQLVYSLATPRQSSSVVLTGRSELATEAEGKLVPLSGPDGKPLAGLGAGEYRLPPDLPGGVYTLTVADRQGRLAPASRAFTVIDYRKPTIATKLDFNRASYGPGDEVVAKATASRAEGGPLRGAKVRVAATADGKPLRTPPVARTDELGEAVVRFRLPAKMERDAALSLTFEDGAAVEPVVKPVPVAVNGVSVAFHPEGGDLVAGVEQRVYFEARTPLGRPAQLRGRLLEDGRPTGVVVATDSDDSRPGVNQGQGSFRFTPVADRTYSLAVESPAGVEAKPELPAVRADGVVLSVPGGVFEPGDVVRASVKSTREATYLVNLYCRGRLLDAVELPRGKTEAELRPALPVGGVCRVTVFEERHVGTPQRRLVPVAERLVYRHPPRRVDLNVAPDKHRYAPGDKASLSVLAVDEREKFTSAVVMLAVTDRTVANMADERTGRDMRSHFLLTTEVRRAEDLEHADFLVGSDPKAAKALDLLLGNQGWRRFAEQSPADFRKKLNEQAPGESDGDHLRRLADGERLLVMAGQSDIDMTDPDEARAEAARAAFVAGAAALDERRERAAKILDEAAKDDDYRAAAATLGAYDAALSKAREALPVVGAALVLLSLVMLARSAAKTSRVGWGVAGAAAAAVLVAGIVGHPRTESPRATGDAREVAQAERPDDVPFLPPHDDADGGGNFGGNPGGNLGGVGIGGMPAPPKPLAGGGKGGFGGRGFGGGLGGGGAMPPAAPGGWNVAGGVAGFPAHAATGGAFLADAKKANAVDEIREARSRQAGRAFDRYVPRNALRAQADVDRLERLALRMKELREAEALARPARGKDAETDGGFLDAPFVVREYAHVHRRAEDGVRADFAETVYWHPALVLKDGRAVAKFDLPDSVTSFDVLAVAHTADGRLGVTSRRIESRLPFAVAPKLPLEVTASDRIDAAFGVANNTDKALTVKLAASTDGLVALDDAKEAKTLAVPADGRARRVLSFSAAKPEGTATLTARATASGFADAARESVRVVPDGFPGVVSASDLLEGSASHKLVVPPFVPGTLAAKVEVFPSTLADLQKGLEGLLREPHGCFEQSSTANYPNVLILDYLRTADKADPAVENRSRDLLGRGYAKLASFECLKASGPAREGFEWFGGSAPPHEALTAYGLLQFKDMARVSKVDPALIDRTRAYLLSRRDGKGGFRRNEKALDTFGRAPAHVTDAYIAWALAETGSDDLTRELTALGEKASSSRDPYFVALVALAHAGRDKSATALDLSRKLATMQDKAGSLPGAATSITGSGGRDLLIESTALGVLAWLKTEPTVFHKNVRDGAAFLGKQRGESGTFGSTQSTILSLKALIAHAAANKRKPTAGTLRAFVGEKMVGELSFPAGVDKPLVIDIEQAETLFKAGDNAVRVEITGEKNHFPHTVSVAYRTTTPPSDKGAPLALQTSLAAEKLAEGASTRLTVRVENVSGKDAGMATAIIGLPAGLGLPEDLKQLRELCRLPADGSRPTVDAFEVRGRELVLYWRDMAKGRVAEVGIDVAAKVPGKYRGPASRAYLYYEADRKTWVAPLGVEIAAE